MSTHHIATHHAVPKLLLAIASLPSITVAQATFEFEDSEQALGVGFSSDIALADLNGDGDLDAFVANTNSDYSRVWMNNGNGVFTDSGQELSRLSTAVGLGDLDGDGDIDAFLPRLGWDHQVWFNSANDGIFINSGQNLRIPESPSSHDVALGDIDNDGDLDAVIANMSSGWGSPNAIWLNDGNGYFTDSGQRLGLLESHSVALGDLDNDGDLDAFFGNMTYSRSGPSLRYNTVWLNDGSGNFTDSGQQLGDRITTSIALGDLDGDGDLDAYAANAYTGVTSNENTVWMNDGNGNFTDSGQTLGLSDSFDVALADLDGDSDLDACIANAETPTFGRQANAIWVNDGYGNFSLSDQTLGDGNSFSIALGQLDSDSDPDAFIGHGAYSTDEQNAVYFNTAYGACCADIGCVQADEATCEMFGGTYLGGHCFEIDCTSLSVTGACCVDTGCSVLTEEICDELGGIWIENGDCGDCPEGMAEDIDNSGSVDGEDLARLLGAWGSTP